jgi:hypothetical protein
MSVKSTLTDMTDCYGSVISSYSRAEMIADGSLVDVTYLAKETRLKVQVAVTQALWSDIVPSAIDSSRWGEDTDGRLWDIFTMLLVAFDRGQKGGSVHFNVFMRMNGELRLIPLKSICGPGDTGEPVITIFHEEADES